MTRAVSLDETSGGIDGSRDAFSVVMEVRRKQLWERRAVQNRRGFLRLLSALAAALPFAPRVAVAAAAPTQPREFFIVNGWVLTRADLIALNIDAV